MPIVDITEYRGRHKPEDFDTAIEQAAQVSSKQDALTTDQMAAVNSGITSEIVGSISGIGEDVSSVQEEVSDARTGTNEHVYSSLSDRLDDYENESFITRGNVANNSDINSYDSSGQWVRGSSAPTVTNWPSGASAVGRLLTFANKSTGTAGIAQFVIDYANRVFVRYKTMSGWLAWTKLQTTGDYTTLDNKIDSVSDDALITRGNMQNNTSVDAYDTAGQWVRGAAVTTVTNWPDGASRIGRLVTFSNHTTGASGIMQVVFDYYNRIFVRWKTGSGWNAWSKVNEDVTYTTLEVGANKQYTSVVAAIKYTMEHPPMGNNRYIIDIEAGTFDLSGCVTYVEASTLDMRGLFIMPGTIIRGAGKDKTVLELRYTGSTDSTMVNVSGLNAPYSCEISDLTVVVKNVRYAIHSDNALATESSNVSNEKLMDTTITCNNCSFIHEGFSSGLTPSYKVPSAWGAGSWDGSMRIFRNCDFISAAYAGFLIHDRIGLTKSPSIIFDNCRAINLGSAAIGDTVNGSSIAFISWGSGVKTNVSIHNCITNKGIALRTTTDNNASAETDYCVRDDGLNLVCESETNNSHKNDNYYNFGCGVGVSTSAISAYSPISIQSYGSVSSYNSSIGVGGIALHDCTSGSAVVYQKAGYIQLSKITSQTFTAGTLLAFNGSAWVESSTNPTLRVVGGGVAEFL